MIRLAHLIPVAILLIFLTCLYLYVKKFLNLYAFFAGNESEYNIRDRSQILRFMLESWGMYFLLAALSFHILWFFTSFVWIWIFIMQIKFLSAWEQHGYSRKVYIVINWSAVIIAYIVSPAVRSLVSTLMQT